MSSKCIVSIASVISAVSLFPDVSIAARVEIQPLKKGAHVASDTRSCNAINPECCCQKAWRPRVPTTDESLIPQWLLLILDKKALSLRTRSSRLQRSIIATAEETQTDPFNRRLDETSLFAALPHRGALGRHIDVQLCDPRGRGYGKRLRVPVRDIGPWRSDDPYWEKQARPVAESLAGLPVLRNPKRAGWFPSKTGRTLCNGAGIDLSHGCWAALIPGLTPKAARNHTGRVNWEFVPPPASP
jgi:hypothetical protein